jgi:hypothetical protein
MNKRIFIIIITILCHNSSHFLLCCLIVMKLYKETFFSGGGTFIEVRRTSFSSQNKTIDENKTMISWDRIYIESLKLLFLGIFINCLCLQFLYFSSLL